MPGQAQLRVQKTQIEPGVMEKQRRIFKELEQRRGDYGERRLVGEKRLRNTVDLSGFFRNVALRIHECVPRPSSWNIVAQFNASNLDNSVAFLGPETRGFRIDS